MKVAREELARECDYKLESANQKRFRDILSGTEGFYVPLVVDNLSGKKVLTTELVSVTGIPIDKVALRDQETRNYIGKKLLELTLKELFVFCFMQTDPNWSNFLFEKATKVINLIDFGATQDYPKSFVDDYLRMVIACANGDRDAVIEMSTRLRFLTGKESRNNVGCPCSSWFSCGIAFFKARLTPPRNEVYSLHRNLSGAFLACVKLGAVVPCRQLILQIYEHHQFGEEDR